MTDQTHADRSAAIDQAASELDGLPLPCECSEDYGPCEAHSIVWAQRAGASCRTADELVDVLILDLVAIHETTDGRLGCLVPEADRGWYETVSAKLDGSMNSRWLDDPDDSEGLCELAWAMEGNAQGLWITHDDGYVIAEVTGGPLSDAWADENNRDEDGPLYLNR